MDTQTTNLMKGSEITIKCLELLGVEVVFAYPGGQAIELHQALSKSKMRVVLPRHEQGGAFAAGGYARISGKVGVCMATSGARRDEPRLRHRRRIYGFDSRPFFITGRCRAR